jgi:hypothetical protein
MFKQDKKRLDLSIVRIMALHKGKDNAIKRAELQHQLRLRGYGSDCNEQTFDRRIRECIETLRRDDQDGAYIVSDCSGTGYWTAETIEELKTYLDTELGRAKAIFYKAHKQSERAGIILEGQLSYG